MPNVKGTLKHGLQIGETLHKDYELRERTTRDMFAAEEAAPASKNFTYSAALAGRQLVRLGELSGPFDLEFMAKLHPEDVVDLIEKAGRPSELGKNDSAS